jgi:glycyl-tRNA synthetase beta chain
VAKDLLLEIGTEEIPAGYIYPALNALKKTALDRMHELRLSTGEAYVWGTPRRLALVIESVQDIQPDLEEEIMGPPVRVAYDETGKPTAAALGFARAQGVGAEDLLKLDTSKGVYVAVRKRHGGRAAGELLSEDIPVWIGGLPFPKSMRWRDLDLVFARPIHWIVALLGTEVIPFSLETISSGRTTRGHRFMKPREEMISEAGTYKDFMNTLFVLADPAERKEVILREARKAAESLNGRLLEDEGLLETVINLVEYPVAVSGNFDPVFLNLPREVLITAMREHQKFFCVEDADGHLMSHFVNIANIRPGSMETIRKGNERVLHARLSDARFFFQEDRKLRLEDRLENLRGVIFHSKLGTLFEKVQRIRGLAVALASELESSRVKEADRAALLCKADLTTEMVGEFPSLQGVMGREYARLQDEAPDVAEALYEHYLPSFSGDRLPSSALGALVGLADKVDTIVGCFGVGEVPTGAGDRFGLRRAALGIIHILVERGYEISLGWIADQAITQLGDWVEKPREEVRSEVLSFFRARLENLWTGQGISAEAVEAVLSSGYENVPDAYGRALALQKFMAEEGFHDLAMSFKRVLNIVGDNKGGTVEPGLFQQPEEDDLLAVFEDASREVDACLAAREPLQALKSLAALRQRIDSFFDAVLVNVDEAKIRENRLNMLGNIGGVFLRLADFSKIST